MRRLRGHSGPYRFIRHPIYTGILAMGAGFPSAVHMMPNTDGNLVVAESGLNMVALAAIRQAVAQAAGPAGPPRASAARECRRS